MRTPLMLICLIFLCFNAKSSLSQQDDGTRPVDEAYKQRVAKLKANDVRLQMKIRPANGRISSYTDPIEVTFKNPTKQNITMSFYYFLWSSELVVHLRDGKSLRCASRWHYMDDGAMQTVVRHKSLIKTTSLSDFACPSNIADDIDKFYLTFESNDEDVEPETLGHYESNSLTFFHSGH